LDSNLKKNFEFSWKEDSPLAGACDCYVSCDRCVCYVLYFLACVALEGNPALHLRKRCHDFTPQ